MFFSRLTRYKYHDHMFGVIRIDRYASFDINSIQKYFNCIQFNLVRGDGRTYHRFHINVTLDICWPLPV